MAMYLRGETWWFEIEIGGRRIRESTGETDERRAITEYEKRKRDLKGKGDEAIDSYSRRRLMLSAAFEAWFEKKKNRAAKKWSPSMCDVAENS